MNTKLLNALRRIVSEQGEAILACPQRLKGFVRDTAQDVPQEERRAFGRCIEMSFYRSLKNSNSAEERHALKTSLAARLQSETGMNAALCREALNLLEALIFDNAQAPSFVQHNSINAITEKIREAAKAVPVSKKTVIFGIAAGFAAFLGNGVSDDVRGAIFWPSGFWYLILEMALWFGILSPFVIIALVSVQHIYQKKIPNIKIIIPVILGIITGAFSSGAAQFVFNYTQRVTPLITNISNALCWGLAGAGLGLGAAFFIPNYPKKHAIFAGALGGVIGGAIYVATKSISYTGSIIGIIILGMVIGFAISFFEEALREAYLTIIWGPKEVTSISLGKNPVTFGSSKAADVFLPRSKNNAAEAPIRAVFMLENGVVIMEDRAAGTRRKLQNGTQIDLGRVKVMISIKKGGAPV